MKRDISDLDAYAFVPEPGGARVITAALAGGKAAVLVFGASGLENIVHPEMPAGCRLTSLAWSVDRKFLYADALCPSAEKSHRQIEFAEIPLQGGPVRMTPVAQLIASGSENEYDSFLRVSLSPDGRMLATSTGSLPGKALRNNADRGLYLVDLTDPNRKVTRAGIPKIPE